MKYETQLKQMQNFIATKLHESGQFEFIDVGYNFKNQPKGSSLRLNTKNQIYCRIKDDFLLEGEFKDFLLLTHVDVMQGNLFASKLEEATRNGMYFSNVLFRYKNDGKDNGPLFKRFVLDDSRETYDRHLLKKGKKRNYRELPIYRKKSLKHYSNHEKNRFRKLTDLENFYVTNTSLGLPFYYQPESSRLNELLLMYKFNDVFFRRQNDQGEFYSEKSIEIKDPELIKSMNHFTLQPIRRPFSNVGLTNTLSSYIKEKSIHNLSGKNNLVNYRFNNISKNGLLLCEAIELPNVETNNSTEILLKHYIANVMHNLQFGFIPSSKDELSVKIKDLLSSDISDDISNLVNDSRGLIIDAKKNKSNISLNIVTRVKSWSEEGKHYFITEKDGNYKCTCPSFKFKNRNPCKHIQEHIDE